MEEVLAEIHYMDGTIHGDISMQVKSSTIIVYKFSHESAIKHRDEEKFKQSGIYLLINSEKNTVYVGQANKRKNGDGILRRVLEPHSDRIDNWNICFILMSSSKNFFEPTELDYLENFFYKEAKDLKPDSVLNASEPSAGIEDSSSVEIKLKTYKQHALLILQQLHCDVFVKNEQANTYAIMGEPSKPDLENKNTAEKTLPLDSLGSAIGREFYIYDKTNSVEATAVFKDSNRHMVVKQNSTISDKNRLPMQKGQDSNAKLREKLIKDKIIVECIFQRDYEFTSPGQSASIIRGRSSDGNIWWHDKGGKEYKFGNELGSYTGTKHKNK